MHPAASVTAATAGSAALQPAGSMSYASSLAFSTPMSASCGETAAAVAAAACAARRHQWRKLLSVTRCPPSGVRAKAPPCCARRARHASELRKGAAHAAPAPCPPSEADAWAWAESRCSAVRDRWPSASMTSVSMVVARSAASKHAVAAAWVTKGLRVHNFGQCWWPCPSLSSGHERLGHSSRVVGHHPEPAVSAPGRKGWRAVALPIGHFQHATVAASGSAAWSDARGSAAWEAAARLQAAARARGRVQSRATARPSSP